MRRRCPPTCIRTERRSFITHAELTVYIALLVHGMLLLYCRDGLPAALRIILWKKKRRTAGIAAEMLNDGKVWFNDVKDRTRSFLPSTGVPAGRKCHG